MNMYILLIKKCYILSQYKGGILTGCQQELDLLGELFLEERNKQLLNQNIAR